MIVAFHSSLMLSSRFFGPYKILALVVLVVYKLELPAGSQIHNIFHIGMLEKQLGLVTPAATNIPPVTDTSEILPQSEKVLDSRVVRKGKSPHKTLVLIKWAGCTNQRCNLRKPFMFFEDLS
ncbi:hypothetical protein Ddye_016166 [Dipteronia dyeriana]|uniref:Tf2-1-like SH3-like domain-containing protein n=1 Tax=Dipteronia dyeriana TaxID=168575 RepID=A0AAD9X015_9ROSI|nr:hypothetical protein Ddye_016166 [Dipteronia dyeriana]